MLRSDALSEAENERVYGKCANPAGHGHDYGLEVTVAGPIDPTTGFAVSGRATRRARSAARARPAFAPLLNDDAWFTTAVPTAENIAIAIEGELRPAVAAQSDARVVAGAPARDAAELLRLRGGGSMNEEDGADPIEGLVAAMLDALGEDLAPRGAPRRHPRVSRVRCAS